MLHHEEEQSSSDELEEVEADWTCLHLGGEEGRNFKCVAAKKCIGQCSLVQYRALYLETSRESTQKVYFGIQTECSICTFSTLAGASSSSSQNHRTDRRTGHLSPSLVVLAVVGVVRRD